MLRLRLISFLMSVSGDGSEGRIIGLCGHDGLYSKCYMYGSERRKCKR